MYNTKAFEQNDLAVSQQLIADFPLGALIMNMQTGINAEHIPFEWADCDSVRSKHEHSDGEHINGEQSTLELDEGKQSIGLLRGHIARANPLWREVDKTEEVLCVFQGPNAYISPNWYPSKAEHGKAVPTWNYAVVHVYGRIKIINEKEALVAHLSRLSSIHEAEFEQPWTLEEAPQDFIDKLVKAIVGIEIEITRIDAKFKLSQNRPRTDIPNIVTGLRKQGTPNSTLMADYVAQAAKEPF